MMERAVERITETTDRDEEQAEAALVAQMPLGRALEPKEIAEAVWFLASPQAAAINGQTLEIA
jgi:NAD(P)-dependent dehydrogenase (short-subunit alcohol dehydrogenase family)